ncbi:NUDIX domain-containing protein [Streptomyces angustmyceticus]|uniref:NUDIX domain-containing protein n=1 Tax=Streptomyces angustmyceticus TaxID=285578 RepID=UPI003D89B1B7
MVIGGGVEDSDATHEDALLREVREEIAGEAEIVRLCHQLKNSKGETEHFYLARITQWNFDDKTGPEFHRNDRGQYFLDEVPLTTEALAGVKLLPEEISHLLREALEHPCALSLSPHLWTVSARSRTAWRRSRG